MVNQLTSGLLAVYWGNSVMVRLVKAGQISSVYIYYFPRLASGGLHQSMEICMALCIAQLQFK